MFENSEPTKIIITCRFIQHDQWLTTHIDPSWTIRQLKLWLVHRLFQISIPPRVFISTQNAGKAAERPPSPITFAPDPRMRPASPIVFAPPKQQRQRRGKGWLSDTTEEDITTDEFDGGDESSELSSHGAGGKGKGIEVGVNSRSSSIPGGRIDPRPPSSTSYHGGGLVVMTESGAIHPGRGNPIISPSTNTPPDDRYPGGVNHHHWTLTRYSTGQIFTDDESLVSWYDVNEHELLELHGLSFPSAHPLYEYQVYHLWNPDRHRERERLRKKLKKRFEAEAKEGGGGRKSTAQQAQILKAMNLNSGAGANVGVVEYYGDKLATKVELTLTRIPRAIDTYVQPYWEGWVRTLRIVWKGEWSDVVAAGHGLISDPYRYGVYNSGNPTGAFGMGVNVYHNPATLGEPPKESGPQHHPDRIVRVEWRERWVRIQNGTLAVLRDRENDDATHVLPLKDILSLTNTQHLIRYLSYTGFNPPLDHPAVTPDILMPALNLPIPSPSPAAAQDHVDSDNDQDTHLHGSQHGHTSSFGPPKECNFTFSSPSHLQRHVKARELTPLVGSRFDPTYLPVTIEEQRASGLRVVCLQFRKNTNMHVHGNHNGGEDVDKERGIDPITLALEDMTERAGEWGGIRSNNPLWKCLPRLKKDPPYIHRVKMRMRMRGGRGGSRGHNSGGSGSVHNSRTRSGGGSGKLTSEHTSTIRSLRDPMADWGYLPPPKKHPRSRRVGQQSKRSMASITSVGNTSSRKERIYDLERELHRPVYKPKSQDKELDIQGILAAQIFGGHIPSAARSYKEALEERERRERKDKRKREKEIEKERAKQEREREKEREKVKGKQKEGKDIWKEGGDKDKERDWRLGSLNIAFRNWGWGKKKRTKKQERQVTESASASTSTLQLGASSTSRALVASGSTSTIMSSGITDPVDAALASVPRALVGGSSATVIEQPSVSWSGDEYGDREKSETSSTDDTTNDEGGDEDEDDEEREALENYPRECPEEQGEGGYDEDEEIEYADLPSTSRHHDNPLFRTALAEEEFDKGMDGTDAHKGATSTSGVGGMNVPSVIVQVAVDKRIEHEEGADSKSGAVAFGGNTMIPQRDTFASFPGPATKRSKRSPSLRTHAKKRAEPPESPQLVKKPSQRLIGQLHSSDEDHGEVDGANGDDDAEMSSPIFAPAPPAQKKPRSVKSASTLGFGGSGGTKSLSSRSSAASIDFEEDNEEGAMDEDLDDDYFGQRRAGYRYGLYGARKEGVKKRAGYERELEEQRERETKIREQRELEARQRERENEEEREREKERERRERRKKDEEGEWVCLDLGNDFAFQSFLRIIHQHCPHPMKSSFMDRIMGGPLDDAPPSPQKLPQSLMTRVFPESANNSAGPSSPAPHSYYSHSQSEHTPQPSIATNMDTILESMDTQSHGSLPNSPTSLRSPRTTSSHSSYKTPPPQPTDPQSPSLPSIPSASSGSSQLTPPSPSLSSSGETDSESGYIAPLPGYGDPRFTYPSRTQATLPYPEWRLNILCKAQRAGMGDVGRAMEMIHWGKTDPVIAEASGTTNESERFAKRWGAIGVFGPGRHQPGKANRRGSRDGGEDNVSSLGTIGPRTVGSGGTVKGVGLGSPSKARKRMSLGGNGSIPESSREGGESGNESSAEDSDDSVGKVSSASSGRKANAKRTARQSPDLHNRLAKWSDDSDEEQASELEWLAWQIDVRRQAKRQYAIQARREANALSISTEPDHGLPTHPADDVRRFHESRRKLEPIANIQVSRINREDLSSTSVSVSHSLSGSTVATRQPSVDQVRFTGAPIIATSSSSARVASDRLSPHHARVPSQHHHTLHHSASLHTGLRKGSQDQPARRPSMPILSSREGGERELKERDKGKGKEWSFWPPQFSAGGDLKSPTMPGSGWWSSSSKRDPEARDMSPSGNVSQPPSASGSIGRSGSVFMKGGLLRKKESIGVIRVTEEQEEREREDTEGEQEVVDEGDESKKTQRPQLRVATSSSIGAGPAGPEAAKSPEQVKSPTFVPKSFVRRMRSDASILSLRAGDALQEGPSSPHQHAQQARKRKGPMDRFMSSTFDFVEGK